MLDRRKLARLITQCRNTFSNISEGTVFLIQGVTANDSSLKRYNVFLDIGNMTSEKINNNKRLMDRAK